MHLLASILPVLILAANLPSQPGTLKSRQTNPTSSNIDKSAEEKGWAGPCTFKGDDTKIDDTDEKAKREGWAGPCTFKGDDTKIDDTIEKAKREGWAGPCTFKGDDTKIDDTDEKAEREGWAGPCTLVFEGTEEELVEIRKKIAEQERRDAERNRLGIPHGIFQWPKKASSQEDDSEDDSDS